MTGEKSPVFVSYAGPDRPWAEWAASVVEATGRFTVELDVWDWRAGDNTILKISQAVERAEPVLALWSPAHLDRHRFTQDEWTAVMADRPDVRTRLVPVRVTQVTPPQVLKSLLYRDVFGLDETAARTELLAAVRGPTGRGGPAVFPGSPAGVATGGAGVTGPGFVVCGFRDRCHRCGTSRAGTRGSPAARTCWRDCGPV